MRNIMRKEMKLSASPLSYLFILFGLMFFLPGYPVLCGAFFVTLGIFQGFQYAREANDIVFSSLLPISKKDVVMGKYLFVCFIEACSLILMLVSSFIRMSFLSEAAVYRANALMNANLFAVGGAFLIFGLFNVIFLGGFFNPHHRILSGYRRFGNASPCSRPGGCQCVRIRLLWSSACNAARRIGRFFNHDYAFLQNRLQEF